MFGRKSKLISELRAEIQRLRDLHAAQQYVLELCRKSYEDMKEIAAKALEAAHEKHFSSVPRKDELFAPQHLCANCNHVFKEPYYGDMLGRVKCCSDSCLSEYNARSIRESRSDYEPPEVKNCPECCVSVRASEWPQECPACHCTFGFEGME